MLVCGILYKHNFGAWSFIHVIYIELVTRAPQSTLVHFVLIVHLTLTTLKYLCINHRDQISGFFNLKAS